MDKDTKQEFETRDKILDGMREEIDSLTGSLSGFKSETAGKLEDLTQAQSSLRDSKDTSSEEAVEENARLNDKVVKLEERNVFLESPIYKNQVIQGFLRDMDSDNFLAIGVKLGYLEDTEAKPEDLAGVEGAEPVEVPLGDKQTLVVSKEKPEDMTGWEYSETQGLYIKLV